MTNVGWLFLAIVIAYGCAIVVPLMQTWLPGGRRVFVIWCFVPVIVGCPLLIPSASIELRAVSAFVSGDITFKIIDCLRSLGNIERRISLRDYIHFLIPFPVLAAVYPDHKRRLVSREAPWPLVLRVLGGIGGLIVALLALRTLSSVVAIQSNFALNHITMLITFVVAIESLSRAIWGLERWAGFDTRPIIQNVYLSRTVSEFWQRYNYRIHDWLYRNVFQPSGGRRAPVRSVLLVFFVSGIFHEVMFAAATSRLTGYQFAFFMIQGPAALVSGPARRLAAQGGIAGKIAAHGVTILFLGVTSVLFFDGVSKVFPFIYASQSPLP